MNTFCVKCTCGKLCKNESGLEQHKRTSKTHRNMETFGAGGVHSNASFFGFTDDGNVFPSSWTPSHSQQITAPSASSSAMPTSATISKSLGIGGELINYGAWNNSASMKAPASKSRLKNPRARTQATKNDQLRVQQSLGSPVADASSSFILGVEPLRCCGKTFKTENAMQQHKRDSKNHPDIRPHNAYTDSDDSDEDSNEDDEMYSYGFRGYSYSFSGGKKGDNFGICDTDCGWCGHCADGLDF